MELSSRNRSQGVCQNFLVEVSCSFDIDGAHGLQNVSVVLVDVGRNQISYRTKTSLNNASTRFRNGCSHLVKQKILTTKLVLGIFSHQSHAGSADLASDFELINIIVDFSVSFYLLGRHFEVRHCISYKRNLLFTKIQP